MVALRNLLEEPVVVHRDDRVARPVDRSDRAVAERVKRVRRRRVRERAVRPLARHAPRPRCPAAHATTASPLALIAAVMLLGFVPAEPTFVSPPVVPFGSSATMSTSLSLGHRARRLNPRGEAVARTVDDHNRGRWPRMRRRARGSGARRNRALRTRAGPPGSRLGFPPASRRARCRSRRRRVTAPPRSYHRSGRDSATRRRPPCREVRAGAPAAPSGRLGRSLDDASGLLQVRVSKSLGGASDHALHPRNPPALSPAAKHGAPDCK